MGMSSVLTHKKMSLSNCSISSMQWFHLSCHFTRHRNIIVSQVNIFLASPDGRLGHTTSQFIKKIVNLRFRQVNLGSCRIIDTGAARSVMSQNLLHKFPQRSRGTCSKLDFDLYDVHDKKLNTLGLIPLPIYYGGTQLLQEFVVTDGIAEECILPYVYPCGKQHEPFFPSAGSRSTLRR